MLQWYKRGTAYVESSQNTHISSQTYGKSMIIPKEKHDKPKNMS